MRGQDFGIISGPPSWAVGLVNAKADVLVPAWIEDVDAPVRERGPRRFAKRINDTAKLAVHPVLPALGAVT